MAKLIVISWRDVPAQVVVKRGRETGKVQLSHRFQEAVDRAAMRAGKASSGDYLADWKRSDPKDCGDDIQAEANAEAARIEALYSDEDLLRIIRAHGVDVHRSRISLVPDGADSGSSRAARGEHGGGTRNPRVLA